MSEKEPKTERKQTTDNNSAKNILESQIDSQNQIKVNN